MQFEDYIRKLGVLDTLKELEYRVKAEVVNRFNDYLGLAREGKLELSDMVVQSYYYDIAEGEYNEDQARAEVLKNVVMTIRELESASPYSHTTPLYHYGVMWNDAPIVASCMEGYCSNKGDNDGNDTPDYSLWEIDSFKEGTTFYEYNAFVCKLKWHIINWVNYFFMDNYIQCADGSYWVFAEPEDWNPFLSYVRSFLLKYVYALLDDDTCNVIAVTSPFERFALRYTVKYILGQSNSLKVYIKDLNSYIMYSYEDDLFPNVDFGDIETYVDGVTEYQGVPSYLTKATLNLNKDDCNINIFENKAFLEEDVDGELSQEFCYFAKPGSVEDYKIQDLLAWNNVAQYYSEL